MDREASTLGPGMDMPIMHDSDRYELVKDIGAGNFGIARLMRDRKSKELVAVKYIERGTKIDENVHREIINHRSLRHPNIIRFKEVILTPTHLAIVMEYASGGELFECICNAGKFSEDELISGVSYCHSMGPLAAPVLQLPTKCDLSKFYFGEFRELDINGAKCFLTRTGVCFLILPQTGQGSSGGCGPWAGNPASGNSDQGGRDPWGSKQLPGSGDLVKGSALERSQCLQGLSEPKSGDCLMKYSVK